MVRDCYAGQISWVGHRICHHLMNGYHSSPYGQAVIFLLISRTTSSGFGAALENFHAKHCGGLQVRLVIRA